MIKKFATLVLVLFLGYVSHAQITIDSTSEDKEPTILGDKKAPSFREKLKNNFFFGGGLAVGGGSGGFSGGINPVGGVSLNQYWDLGMALNFNYNSTSSDYSYDGLSRKLTTYGLGPFVRFNPIDWLFVQGQFEQNWGNSKVGSFSKNFSASSLIGSLGYRSTGEGNMGYFFSIGMDFLKNEYSPYRNVEYSLNPKTNNWEVSSNKPMPIIRAGVFFYLH